MTKRLYLTDPYTTQFEGRVRARLEHAEGPAIILEETYFYPESGGQPYDLGTIGGSRVVRVIEQAEDILHVVDRLPESDVVRCEIDADRRRDHMQQHNGQHLLSAAFLQEAGCQTLSFHLGTTTSTIDLDRAPIEPERIAAVEREANRAVRRNLPIRTYSIDAQEAPGLKLRKAPEVEGILRIVDVEGFDRQACCGTHPRATGEVGTIVIRGFERFKKGTRVEFVCGERALGDHKTSVERLRALARVLSSPEEQLVEAATKLVDERKELLKSLARLREEILQHRSAGWIAEAETVRALKVVVREVPDVTPGELRWIAVFLAKEPLRVALLGARAEGRAHLVFSRSPDAPGPDMSRLLHQVLPMLDGHGGGSPHVAQGGGARVDGLGKALQAARGLLVNEEADSRSPSQ